MLNVGGKQFATSAATLLAGGPGSLFWQLAHSSAPEDVLPRTAAGELFIDRDGKVSRKQPFQTVSYHNV